MHDLPLRLSSIISPNRLFIQTGRVTRLCRDQTYGFSPQTMTVVVPRPTWNGFCGIFIVR